MAVLSSPTGLAYNTEVPVCYVSLLWLWRWEVRARFLFISREPSTRWPKHHRTLLVFGPGLLNAVFSYSTLEYSIALWLKFWLGSKGEKLFFFPNVWKWNGFEQVGNDKRAPTGTCVTFWTASFWLMKSFICSVTRKKFKEISLLLWYTFKSTASSLWIIKHYSEGRENLKWQTLSF